MVQCSSPGVLIGGGGVWCLLELKSFPEVQACGFLIEVILYSGTETFVSI